MPALRRIDVHHHPAPPSYLAARGGRDNRYTAQEAWSTRRSLDDMDRGGVVTAMLSLPHSVQIWPGDAEGARILAREWNEYMARMALDHPGRFGVFACLPILDVEGSLREIEHAFDTLKVDGVALMTNIGDRWLGDPHYTPVFDELNRRGAVVYTHPVAPNCCRGLLPEFNDAVLEYCTDTSRAIAKLLFTGAASRYPRIRFIFSHAGGTMPLLIDRLQWARENSSAGNGAELIPDGVIPSLNKFYYDTAQVAHRFVMASFRETIDVSRLMFGTDFPYLGAEEQVRSLRQCGFSESELNAIEYGTARSLLNLA